MDTAGEDTFAALYARAVRLLAVRMRAEAELRMRLETGTRVAGPGDPETVERVITRLKKERLIDDRRFAFEAARSRFTYRHQGVRRVLMELTRLGVSSATAETSVAEALEEAGGEETVLRQAMEKRLRVGGRPKDRKGLARLLRHFASNGHPPDLVRRLLAREFPKLLD
jgi:SOS response regulatory protein OraA/RecX